MKDKILMVVFVLVLGSLLTTILVLVSAWTAPVISRNEELSTKSSVLAALGIGYDEQEIEAAFDENVQAREQAGQRYYLTRSGEVAFPYTGAGLWGPIEGIIALRPDLQHVRGITVIRQEETPGLGSRITEAGYLAQFVDKKITSGLKLVAAGRSSAENEVDAISGATMTSVAFIDILNDNLREAVPAIEQGEKP